MAIDRISRAQLSSRLVGGVQWFIHHFFSLEMLLILFLYGQYLKNVMPATPIPEALFYSALSVAVGGWIVLRDGIYLRGVPIVLAGLLLIAWMVLSVGWTPSRVLVWVNLRFLLTVDLWALFAGACIIAASRERAVRLLVMIMALALSLAVYGIYIELVHGSFRFYFYLAAGEEWTRGTYITWGYIVANGAVVILPFAIFSKPGSPKQLLAILALATCGYFLLIAAARGPLLALLLAGLLAAFVQAPRIGHGRIKLPQTQLVAYGLLGMGLAYVGYFYATGQTVSAIERFLQLFTEADDPLLRTGANRFDYFAFAYRMWLEAPLVGRGLSSFAIIWDGGFEGHGAYPHNAILQVLAEFGLVGLVLFVIFVVAGLRHFGLARLRRDPLSLLVVMLFVTVFVQSMVQGDFTNSYRFFFIVGLLAMPPPMAEEDEEDPDEEDVDKAEDEAKTATTR